MASEGLLVVIAQHESIPSHMRIVAIQTVFHPRMQLGVVNKPIGMALTAQFSWDKAQKIAVLAVVRMVAKSAVPCRSVQSQPGGLHDRNALAGMTSHAQLIGRQDEFPRYDCFVGPLRGRAKTETASSHLVALIARTAGVRTMDEGPFVWLRGLGRCLGKD
ncbi:MAG: hypothetical protein AUK28_02185 [Desulfobacterales bacterium CG2_30_60_27]|nr:MAG: hypothetical protein AUK28_02185 [Desulfobacterales bacterium CG2_30_60_27]